MQHRNFCSSCEQGINRAESFVAWVFNENMYTITCGELIFFTSVYKVAGTLNFITFGIGLHSAYKPFTLMKKNPAIILFSFLGLSVFAQKEWSNWYFNGNNLLTFKNGYPQIVQGFTTPPPPPANFFHFSNWGSGGISYSDSLTGKMGSISP